MGSERVTFKTADGVALKGDFFRAGSSTSPGVVLAQGLSLLKEHYIEDTARRDRQPPFRSRQLSPPDAPRRGPATAR
jgi:hypothetical protein